jgi:hypothetical protein
MAERRELLTDHRRKGKVLVPPFTSLVGDLKEVSWIRTIVPQLVWIDLVQQKFGHQHGVKLITELGRVVRKNVVREPSREFGSISHFSDISIVEANAVCVELTKINVLQPLKQAIRPLVALYPRCSLRFLFSDDQATPEPSDINLLKERLLSLFKREGRDSMMVQATYVWLMFDSDKLKVSPDLSLAKFPEIDKYPDTELSRRIGSMIRALLNGRFGAEEDSENRGWSEYFWNQGLQLDKCDSGWSE